MPVLPFGKGFCCKEGRTETKQSPSFCPGRGHHLGAGDRAADSAWEAGRGTLRSLHSVRATSAVTHPFSPVSSDLSPREVRSRRAGQSPGNGAGASTPRAGTEAQAPRSPVSTREGGRAGRGEAGVSLTGAGAGAGRGPGRQGERSGGEQREAGSGRRHGPSVRDPRARPGAEGAAPGAGGGHGSRTELGVAPPRPGDPPLPALLSTAPASSLRRGSRTGQTARAHPAPPPATHAPEPASALPGPAPGAAGRGHWRCGVYRCLRSREMQLEHTVWVEGQLKAAFHRATSQS
ncbi:hypothetical protein NN561_005309 [Cricetulus griseus]